MKYDIYCYGMIAKSVSFLLEKFPEPDNYSELAASYEFSGGETGTCATVLESLGVKVKIDGTHIGSKVASLVKESYKDKNVDLTSLTFDDNFDGVEDFILISGNTRTPMGTYARFFTEAYKSGIRHWNKPKESDISACTVAAIDSCFMDDSDLAAEFCIKHNKPYVTIDCQYDSYIHKNAAVSIISGEGLQNNYPNKSRDELFPLFQENSNGITVITNGGNTFHYGRKGERMKSFEPYKVHIASTLGAGDSFKAGCTYALLKGMNDDELIRFASACAAVAISRYPLQLNPPKLNEIEYMMRKPLKTLAF